MWIVFLLIILILGILFSKIEINLNELYFNEKNYNFKITVSLKLFFVIKVISIKFDKNRALLLGKKLNINKYKIKKFDKRLFNLIEKFKINRIQLEQDTRKKSKKF